MELETVTDREIEAKTQLITSTLKERMWFAKPIS